MVYFAVVAFILPMLHHITKYLMSHQTGPATQTNYVKKMLQENPG